MLRQLKINGEKHNYDLDPQMSAYFKSESYGLLNLTVLDVSIAKLELGNNVEWNYAIYPDSMIL